MDWTRSSSHRAVRTGACLVLALAASRTAVYALDVTDADHHTMEFSLERVAEATGGFYARTHEGASLAMARLRGAPEALEFVRSLAFDQPEAAFDAAFSSGD